jgi:hypothetical protein
MRIIITENQHFVLRRIQTFIDIVEEQIEGYEKNEDGAWWCKYNTPDTFLDQIRDRSIEEFVDSNWDFFHDRSENGGSDMDLSVLDNLVDENYGNYIRNLYVRKCNQSRF